MPRNALNPSYNRDFGPEPDPKPDLNQAEPSCADVYAKEHGIPDDTVQSYSAVEKQCEPHGRAEWCDYNLTAGCQPLGHHDQPPHSTEPPTA